MIVVAGEQLLVLLQLIMGGLPSRTHNQASRISIAVEPIRSFNKAFKLSVGVWLPSLVFFVILQSAWETSRNMGCLWFICSFFGATQILHFSPAYSVEFCTVYYACLLWPNVGYMVILDGFT